MSNDSKHTPGPWVYKSNGSYFDVGVDNHECSAIPVYPTVCMGVLPTQEDNARLIAAAPELLEALEVMVGQFGSMQNLDYDEQLAVSDARTVIAKAKGKSNADG